MGLAIEKNEFDDIRPEVWVGHVSLKVSKLKESLDFFKLVGMRQVARLPGMAILELRGGTHLVLRHDRLAENISASFDLMVDDLKTMRLRLIDAGYHPSEISKGVGHKDFTVKDPSGTTVQFTNSHVMGPV